MLNALYPNVNWQKIRYVGLDIDGTVYDEVDFISQVYSQIVSDLLENNRRAYSYMLNRWLEKGSSYTKIFDETFDLYPSSGSKEDFIKNALSIFRNYDPALHLATRSKVILSYLSEHYKTFAVTDGNPVLQRKKVNSLEIDAYVAVENIIYSGDYKLSKPDHLLLQHLPNWINPETTVFLGDRNKDRDFANVLGCEFIKVYNMLENA